MEISDTYAVSEKDRVTFRDRGYVQLSHVVDPEVFRKEASVRLALEEALTPAMRSDHSCIYEACPSTLLTEVERTDLSAYLQARRALGLADAEVLRYLCDLLPKLIGDLLADASDTKASVLTLLNEQYIIKGANGGRATKFDWHQDSSGMPKEYQSYVSLWIALDDCGEDNGTLYIRDKEQHFGDKKGPDASEIGVPLLFNAGDAVVLSSTVWHRSGSNISSMPRRAYMPQYILSTDEPAVSPVALQLRIPS